VPSKKRLFSLSEKHFFPHIFQNSLGPFFEPHPEVTTSVQPSFPRKSIGSILTQSLPRCMSVIYFWGFSHLQPSGFQRGGFLVGGAEKMSQLLFILFVSSFSMFSLPSCFLSLLTLLGLELRVLFF
jgi:hypothetical protein